jgi:hypothetical protein
MATAKHITERFIIPRKLHYSTTRFNRLCGAGIAERSLIANLYIADLRRAEVVLAFPQDWFSPGEHFAAARGR